MIPITKFIRKNVTAKKPWVTEEMLLKMKERRKWKHQITEEARSQYRKLNNELKRETEKAREIWWNEQCCQLEELQRQGRQDKVFKVVYILLYKEKVLICE